MIKWTGELVIYEVDVCLDLIDEKSHLRVAMMEIL